MTQITSMLLMRIPPGRNMMKKIILPMKKSNIVI